jgi:predicted P-loop ATPase
MSDIEKFEQAVSWTEKDEGPFQKHNRDDFAFKLAIKCCKARIDKNFAYSEMLSRYKEGGNDPFTERQILKCLTSGYKSNGHAIIHKQKAVTRKIEDIATRPLNEVELEYWKQYGITQEILQKYKVLAVSQYLVGKHHESSVPGNPIFCYQISKTTYKIYRPLKKEGENKFMWIGKKPENWFFGLDFCQGSQAVFIAAGEKDTLTLTCQGKEAFTLNSETASMPADLAEKLKKQYQNIIVIYDTDVTGVKGSQKICKDFGFSRGILPGDIKDVSDLIRAGRSMDEIKYEQPKTIEKPDSMEEPTLFMKVENFIKKRYDVQYNEVSNEVEYKKKDEENYIELNSNNLFIELEHNRLKISQPNLEAILRSDIVTVYNPFTKYFSSLPAWSEKDPDYIELLANHVTAVDQVEFNYHLKKALVRTVACAINDKYYNKHAFILVGKKQHTGKTYFIQYLCPPELKDYITENFSALDKDTQISLSANFMFNLDELAGLSKTDINALKAFFSKEYVKVRHPYGKKAMRSPRRASFFGSTNNMEFLTDGTGTVRWLCFEMVEIDFKYSDEIDINKVWAQAYNLYKSNFTYQLNAEDLKRNELRNKIHQKRTVEMELIQEIFYPGTEYDHDFKLSATEIAVEIKSQYPNAPLSFNAAQIVGNALSILGFTGKNMRFKNIDHPAWKYFMKLNPGKNPISFDLKDKNQLTTLLQNNEELDDLPF